MIIDPMSNTAFLGRDEDGLPIPAAKSAEYGCNKLTGDLQLPPPPRFQIMHEIDGENCVLGPTSQVRPGHLLRRHHRTGRIRNFGQKYGKCLAEVAAAGERTAEDRILNILEFFGPLESPYRRSQQ